MHQSNIRPPNRAFSSRSEAPNVSEHRYLSSTRSVVNEEGNCQCTSCRTNAHGRSGLSHPDAQCPTPRLQIGRRSTSHHSGRQSQSIADAAANLYLQPAGFDLCPGYSNVSTLDMPEVVPGGTLNDAVNQGEQQLVSTIEARLQRQVTFGDDNPLYVFGYSQSDVVMGDGRTAALRLTTIPQGRPALRHGGRQCIGRRWVSEHVMSTHSQRGCSRRSSRLSTSSEPMTCWEQMTPDWPLPDAGLFAVRRWMGELRRWRSTTVVCTPTTSSILA